MTAEEIDKLEGRTLDAAVCSRILGWSNVEPDCFTPIGRDWCGDDPEATFGFNGTGRRIIPRFSTDIRDAWQIVNRIHFLVHYPREGQHPRNCLTLVCTGTTTGWVASFDSKWYKDVFRGSLTSRGDTPAVAICRAALKAMEIVNADQSEARVFVYDPRRCVAHITRSDGQIIQCALPRYHEDTERKSHEDTERKSHVFSDGNPPVKWEPRDHESPCTCSSLDWTGHDMAKPHHPQCPQRIEE